MISRLTASATLFAVLATTGIAFATEARQRPSAPQATPTAPVPTLTLPRVEVIGKRLAGS